MKREKSKTLVTCKRCNGEGRIALSDKLQPVYDAIKHQRGITSHEISSVVGLQGFHATAINQRLDELLAMDLIERTRIGKSFQYYVRKAHKGK